MSTEHYWSSRYREGNTGWDIGSASTPLVALAEWLDPESRILIPGAGNAHEAPVFRAKGFNHVHVLDISPEPIEAFKQTYPDYPEELLHCADFFDLKERYDIMLEQTFFCALPRSMRGDYVDKAYEILKPGGLFCGVMFAMEFEKEGPPHGGTIEEYTRHFEAKFDIEKMEPCYNSIPPRQGAELFVRLRRKGT